MRNKKRTTAISIFISLILFLYIIFTQSDQFEAAYVKSVVDGDTIKVEIDNKTYTVRLIGVNTPETNHPTKGVEPYGLEAKKFTKTMLSRRTVWLEFDVDKKDKYGRFLAYVWLEKPKVISKDQIRKNMFNAILLLEGYAQVMTIPPNVKYAEYFLDFQREAIQNKKGLWELKN